MAEREYYLSALDFIKLKTKETSIKRKSNAIDKVANSYLHISF